MAKKPMLSVPFHQMRVDVFGDHLILRLQKKIKGGRVVVGTIDCDRKDLAKALQDVQDVHDSLTAVTGS